mmetsp:Transcript_129780/g.403639  ORF Transcript_129780/g.403639 Transcript_129780/m.403639 type:complete len:281 (-) Transcript_129780:304-1146(-)
MDAEDTCRGSGFGGVGISEQIGLPALLRGAGGGADAAGSLHTHRRSFAGPLRAGTRRHHRHPLSVGRQRAVRGGRHPFQSSVDTSLREHPAQGPPHHRVHTEPLAGARGGSCRPRSLQPGCGGCFGVGLCGARVLRRGGGPLDIEQRRVLVGALPDRWRPDRRRAAAQRPRAVPQGPGLERSGGDALRPLQRGHGPHDILAGRRPLRLLGEALGALPAIAPGGDGRGRRPGGGGHEWRRRGPPHRTPGDDREDGGRLGARLHSLLAEPLRDLAPADVAGA